MKSKVKRVLFILIILFLFSNIMIGDSSNEEDKIIEGRNGFKLYEENLNQLKQSTSWIFIGTTISINNNWKEIKDTFDWCNGEGTENDPYIIENVTIDAQGSESCIEIQNSDEYFIIQNCILYNSGSVYDAASIYLNNITNGRIINNYCYNNIHGIKLWHSDKNTILGNFVSDNNNNGIMLFSSNDNLVSGNNGDSNGYTGIVIWDSHNNTFLDNTANNNDAGISVTSSNDNMIMDNSVNNNSNAIELLYSNNNTFSRNTLSYNDYYGIVLDNSNNNTFLGNILSYNDYYGIYIHFSDNNRVSGNIMTFCGISLKGRLNNVGSHIIDDTNLVNNKPVYYYVNEIFLSSYDFTDAGQIILVNCNNSIISGYNLSYCSLGIYLGYSHNNTVLGNTANNNDYGIELWFSVNNTISGNTANHNSEDGIHLYESNHSTVSGNTVSYNAFHGIFLVDCDNSKVSGNILNNNDYYGIWLASSNNNKVLDNTASDNDYYGIVLGYGDNNTISGNIVNNNAYYGIQLYGSSNNRIFLNIITNNGQNALDDYGTNNKWDNGFIGNYWDDYQGIDIFNDGIGDSPYSIPGTTGSQDNFPIWNDVDQSFGIYFLLFAIITILSFILISFFSRKKKLKVRLFKPSLKESQSP